MYRGKSFFRNQPFRRRATGTLRSRRWRTRLIDTWTAHRSLCVTAMTTPFGANDAVLALLGILLSVAGAHGVSLDTRPFIVLRCTDENGARVAGVELSLGFGNQGLCTRSNQEGHAVIQGLPYPLAEWNELKLTYNARGSGVRGAQLISLDAGALRVVDVEIVKRDLRVPPTRQTGAIVPKAMTQSYSSYRYEWQRIVEGLLVRGSMHDRDGDNLIPYWKLAAFLMFFLAVLWFTQEPQPREDSFPYAYVEMDASTGPRSRMRLNLEHYSEVSVRKIAEEEFERFIRESGSDSICCMHVEIHQGSQDHQIYTMHETGGESNDTEDTRPMLATE
ncbi:hypothetical protein AAMO2058_000217300 [Amorphochlora amoebiformis]